MTTGDIYTYTPKNNHCTEGLAIEDERGRLYDWYWGSSRDSMLDKIVSRDAADLEFVANLNDYELTARDGLESNKDYAREDRLVITSQHGYQRTYYIRKGAKPDLPTKIENARQRIIEAEAGLRSAEFKLQWAQEDLVALMKDEE